MTRRYTWRLHAVSAIALVLCAWAFLGQVRLASLPPDRLHDADLYPGRLAGVDVASRGEARRLAEFFPPGAELEFRTRDEPAEAITLVRAHSSTYLTVTLISGLFFWAVSAFVFAPRIGQRGVWSFYGCTLLFGVSVMIGGVYFPRSASTAVLNVVQLAALAALPVLFLCLCLDFPRTVAIRHRRGLLTSLSLVAVGCIVWQLVAFTGYFRDPDPASASRLVLPQLCADVLLVTLVAAGVVVLIISMRRLDLDRERRQAQWMLLGMVIGVTPYVFLRTLPQLVGLEPFFGQSVDRVFELAIPTSFVLAVARYRFLDIDIIIRRGLIYGILAAGGVLFYTIVAVSLGQRIESTTPETSWIVFLLIGVGAGVLFFPLRSWIGRLVDRTFFRLRRDHNARLAALRDQLLMCPEERVLAAALSTFLAEALEPQRHEVVWLDPEKRGDDPEPAAARALRTLAAAEWAPDRLVGAPNSTGQPELESPEFPASLQELGIVLSAPIRVSDTVAGLLLLGAKKTGRRYVEPDIRFLDRVTELAGDALERVRLAREVAEQEAARRRSEEMNRLKSDFLSRAAHDLRTPLTSIRWSVDNLLDGAVGDVTPAQMEYLRAIRGSAGYLGRLVANLLEISRLEQEPGRLDLMPVDLETALRGAIATMRPLAAEKQVELRLLTTEDGEPILGNAEKIEEIAVNLLDNAIKFSPPGKPVDVTIENGDASLGAFSVRDRGAGFGKARPEDMFCRFCQGEASPHSPQKGFGLGLYIVKEYMTLMQGQVEAEQHPDGGAVLHCRFRRIPACKGART